MGPDVFPVLVGQFITDWPMFVMYLTAIVVLICIGLFVISAVFGQKVLAEKEKDKVESEGSKEMKELQHSLMPPSTN